MHPGFSSGCARVDPDRGDLAQRVVTEITVGWDMTMTVNEWRDQRGVVGASIDCFDSDGNHLLMAARSGGIGAVDLMHNLLPSVIAHLSNWRWTHTYINDREAPDRQFPSTFLRRAWC